MRISVLMLFLLMQGVFGCKRPNPTPEVLDPIYKDIVYQLDDAKKESESVRKELESARKDFAIADPQNGEARVRRQRVFDLNTELWSAEQKVKYLELQVERRREYARKSYEKAFEKDEAWPNPEEFRLYQAHRNLVTAPKSYDQTHKRRLQERKPASKK